MEPNLTQLNLQAKTENFSVENLIKEVTRGQVRIPQFQRPLRWEAKDVVALFDSIYKGYPIGSLLLSIAKGEAEEVTIGPIKITAPEVSSALWVVDGQQRITALTSVLLRPVPIPQTPEDPWVVYFDAIKQIFISPSSDGQISSNWVPVTVLLDAASLSEWVYNWENSKNADARKAIFEAGSRIREYKIPAYIVESGDEHIFRDIFHRINNYGVSLRWSEIHDALFGNKGLEALSTLGELAEEIEHFGMGKPEEAQLLTCLLAYKGLNVTQSFDYHYRRDESILKDAVKDALPAIRKVMSFLQNSAKIPHLRLLPRSIPLPILTRFFALHPKPNYRTIALLTRWTWRTLLGNGLFNERTLLRRAVSAIKVDEEESIQSLIRLASNKQPASFSLPSQFDSRAATSRIVLVCLASLKPLDLLDGQDIDVAKIIEDNEIGAFRKVVPTSLALGRSPANRILSVGNNTSRKDIIDMSKSSMESLNLMKILQSHAISSNALSALKDNKTEEFLKERKQTIEFLVDEFGTRLAAWGQSDRPTIEYLLQEDGDSEK